MDGLGLLNASRVMTTCRKDGVVLKPDAPLKPPDTCFRAPFIAATSGQAPEVD